MVNLYAYKFFKKLSTCKIKMVRVGFSGRQHIFD